MSEGRRKLINEISTAQMSMQRIVDACLAVMEAEGDTAEHGEIYYCGMAGKQMLRDLKQWEERFSR